MSLGPTNAEAALALGYIEDPIAVPFLRQVLLQPAGRQIEQRVAEGLARIRSDESIGVLIKHLEVENYLTRFAVTSALGGAEASATDQNLKGRISAALASIK